MNFESFRSTGNEVAIIVSLTNFANAFLNQKNPGKFGYNLLFTGRTPAIRPADEMKQLNLTDSAAKLHSSDKLKSDLYYAEVREMIKIRREESKSHNIVLLDINVLPPGSSHVLSVFGSGFCHPLIYGRLVFHLQASALPVSYAKAEIPTHTSMHFGSPRHGVHVIQLGLPRLALETNVYPLTDQSTENVVFGAMAIAQDAAKMLNILTEI